MHSDRHLLYGTISLKLLSMATSVVIVLAMGKFIQKLIYLPDEIKSGFCYRTAAIIGVCIIIKIFAMRWEVILSSDISQRVKSGLRTKLFNKIYSFGMTYSKRVNPSEIVQLSVEGIEQLQVYYSLFLPQLVYSVLSPLMIFIVLATINWKIALFLILPLPIIPVAIIFIQKLAKQVMKRYWGSFVDLSDKFLDLLKGMTVLKTYGAVEDKRSEMSAASEDFRLNTMRVLALQLHNITVMDLGAYGGAALGIFASLYFFIKGEINLGSAIVFILLSSEFFLPLRLLGSFFHVAMNGLAAADKIFSVLEIPEEKEEGEDFPRKPVDIELKDISFAYEGRDVLLHDLSMKFEKKKVTAVVGTSGCGKSTVAALIMGVMPPVEGEIIFGETCNASKKSRLENISLIDNAPFIFNESVEYNLKMGQADVPEKVMIEILEDLGLDEELSEQNEDVLRLKLTEGGSNLSGGQKQRLSMARAYIKNSPIQVFDEATSNIDLESEESIMEKILRDKQKHTTVIISHRLENARKCDFIYFMEDGKVTEKGTFKEIMSFNGGFKKMYEEQHRIERWGIEAKEQDNELTVEGSDDE